MNIVATLARIAALATCVLVITTPHDASAAESRKKVVEKNAVQITKPLQPDCKDWAEKHLIAGKSILLSNSYLFQVMKGIAQENQKAVEETVLVPLLRDTLQGLVATSDDPEVQRLFGVPLALLGGSKADLPPKIREEAETIKQHPLFKPRGHYSESEDLQRYFQAMQYLSKATIDVSTDPGRFPFPKEMLYPFSVASAVRKLFVDPTQSKLVQRWQAIHTFYQDINGPADLPTFMDVRDQFKGKDITKEQVLAWTKAHHMPRINAERGVGIQPFGERFTAHQLMIDQIKAKFIKDDTSREEVGKILRFRNLLMQSRANGHKTGKLPDALQPGKGDTYYACTLRSIEIGSRGWATNPMRLNFLAASLTSLAEQTALMTKTSTMVQKSAESLSTIPKGVKLYFEPGSKSYLLALGRASLAMKKACTKLMGKVEPAYGKNLRLADPSTAVAAFAKLAGKSKPLVTSSPLWKSFGKYVTELPRRPACAVDVFQLMDRTGKMSFYQWAIAPFRAVQAVTKSKIPGLEMVFFEGWMDEIVPGSAEPVDNRQWEQRIQEGNLTQLDRVVTLPPEKAAP